MKSSRILIVAAAALALLGGAARATPVQTNAVPQCQFSPNAVDTGTPPSCGLVLGYIGNDGKFHQVSQANPLPTSSAGGGSAAVTVASGADVAEGAVNDASSAHTVVGFLNGLFGIFNASPPATAANQATANSSLSSIATNTTGASTAANQSTGNSSLATIATNTTGAATAANQATANSSLTTIATNTTGASTAANQTATQAIAGSNPSKVEGVQGCTGCTPITVNQLATSSGGLSIKSLQVANNTTSVAVDASPGQLYNIEAFNNSSVIAYVKLYDASQGSTTCGSGTPKYRGMIPAATAGGAGYLSMNPIGLPFATAITSCVTTGYGDSDTTAPAASAYTINFLYK